MSSSFKVIYDSHVDLVYTLCMRYVKRTEIAEDLTQDVFIKVFQKHHDFKKEAQLKTWIYRITVNTCLDYLKSKRHKNDLFNQSEESLRFKAALVKDPSQLLESSEKMKLLIECIEQLNDKQKTAFLLSKEEGMSNPEIAEIMETSISSVESLIFRAKKNLKEIIANKLKL